MVGCRGGRISPKGPEDRYGEVVPHQATGNGLVADLGRWSAPWPSSTSKLEGPHRLMGWVEVAGRGCLVPSAPHSNSRVVTSSWAATSVRSSSFRSGEPS